MPAAIQYELNTKSDEYRQIEDDYAKEAVARAQTFEVNWQFYDGIMPEPLKVGKDRLNDNVTLPKVGQVVDKITSFLIGDGIEFDSQENNEQDENDRRLDALWQANRKQLWLGNMAMAGALMGHCWARIEPQENALPRIVNLNPANCTAFWDVSDVERVLWYRLQFLVGTDGPGKRIDYIHGRFTQDGVDHDIDEWWELVFTTKGGPDSRWEKQEPRRWPYGWSPIVEWQNLPRPFRFYGLDDVSQIVRLNKIVNFVTSNYSRILKYHAYPKTIGLGFEAGDVIETEIGGFYTVNKSKNEAHIYNLEMASDLASSRSFIDMLAAEIWHTARMVDPQSIKDKVGDITNFGLRVLYADAIHKIGTKRLLYGEGLEILSKHGLELMNVTPPEEIAIIWPDIMPENELEISQRLTMELAAGVIDKQTYRELVGYDHDQIIERLAEQGANEDNLGARLLAAFEAGR